MSTPIKWTYQGHQHHARVGRMRLFVYGRGNWFVYRQGREGVVASGVAGTVRLAKRLAALVTHATVRDAAKRKAKP